MIKPTNPFGPDTIECLSNIPAGYFMEVDTPGHVPYRLAGTSHRSDYNTVEVGAQ